MSATRAAGFTLIELLIVITLICILAALCAPFLLAAKSASNEASAIGSLKAINTAEASYAATCGRQYFATAVANLINDGHLEQDLAMPSKSGYVVVLASGAGAVPGSTDCLGQATETAYYASATPMGATAGRRGFATNQGGVVWEDRTGAAPTEPFGITPDVSPIQ